MISPLLEMTTPVASRSSSASLPSLNRIPSTMIDPSTPVTALVLTLMVSLNRSSSVGCPSVSSEVLSFLASDADTNLDVRSSVPKNTSFPFESLAGVSRMI